MQAIRPSQRLRHPKQPRQQHAQQQQDAFHSRKLQTLNQLAVADKSPKGSVDDRCWPIMRLLNSHPDFVTTSSCSGRVSLTLLAGTGVGATKDSKVAGQKRESKGAKWLYVSHDGWRGDGEPGWIDHWLRKWELPCRCPYRRSAGDPRDYGNVFADSAAHSRGATAIEADEEEQVADDKEDDDEQGPQLHLKVDPFIMHIECRTLEAGRRLLAVAIQSGYRNSGLSLSTAGRVMLAIRQSASLEAPLCRLCRRCRAPVLWFVPTQTPQSQQVSLAYGRLCNAQLEANWQRMARLLNSLQCAFGVPEGECV